MIGERRVFFVRKRAAHVACFRHRSHEDRSLRCSSKGCSARVMDLVIWLESVTLQRRVSLGGGGWINASESNVRDKQALFRIL